MKNKIPMFHLKGYDRVMAIHKLKESINKYGDKLGKKSKILNNIRNRNIIGNNFINLTINKIKLNEEIKPSHKINLINKKIQNNEDDYKIETPIKKKRIKTGIINNLLKEENSKIDNEKDILSNSYDYKMRETDIFSNIIKKDTNNKVSDLIPNMKNYNSIKKNKTYNNFYNLLNKELLSNDSNHKYEYQDQIPIIKPIFIKQRKYKYINYRNKTIIPKFRSLKLGTKPLKMKLNCKIIKLEKKYPSFSIGSNKPNDVVIKKRILFYNKYKKTKDMKLTKSKASKSQNNLFDNEIFWYKNGDNTIIKDNTKNFGQQTINSNMNKTQSMNCNLLRIYSYIRLPNINRINYPDEKLNLVNYNYGINSNFFNNNYFYLKDIKNQSINKIFMINPYIRNRIINN